jgi:hypothetical protein
LLDARAHHRTRTVEKEDVLALVGVEVVLLEGAAVGVGQEAEQGGFRGDCEEGFVEVFVGE